MYKIAILGCENSHAKNFLDLIAAGAYPEIEVVGVYSNEPEAAKKLADRFGVAILDCYDAATLLIADAQLSILELADALKEYDERFGEKPEA